MPFIAGNKTLDFAIPFSFHFHSWSLSFRGSLILPLTLLLEHKDKPIFGNQIGLPGSRPWILKNEAPWLPGSREQGHARMSPRPKGLFHIHNSVWTHSPSPWTHL